MAPGDKKITLEEAKKMQDLVNKARKGQVIPIPEKGMPEKSARNTPQVKQAR